ncbi:DUF2975 domain-containing protein [Dyella telluris]|uniref:DUF2975 domain-containing protein n=1 Tax=Dyella telluris TaxID=2763498 RepID=A0A7G8Q2L4_9GAMM|nr:DUF2975 domain-containing protein [Dyella telluris]QNK01022.1 DUF2975 domain-containing protein [Dyella telluris]
MRLTRAARRLALACWLAAVACLVTTAAGIWGKGNGGDGVAALLSTGGLPHAWAALMAAVLALVTSAALAELARMLGRVRPDALFSSAATKHFRRFAGLLMLAAVLRVVLPAAARLWLASQSGAHSASLEFNGDDLLSLLPAAVFFFVARLFDEAARLEDDQRSIV